MSKITLGGDSFVLCRLTLLYMVFSTLLACSPKQVVHSKPDPKVKVETPVVGEDQDKEDPDQDADIKRDKDDMKTIQDIYDTDSDSGPQSKMHLAVLLPLKAKSYYPMDKPLDEHTERFLNFYQGLLLGFEEFSSEGFDIHVEAYDTKRNGQKLKEILSQLEASEAQIVIGGFTAENIKTLAGWGLEQKRLVVSPWRSSRTVTTNNPYFLQINPTLDSYLMAIVQHLQTNFSQDQVVLIGKDEPRIMKRIERIQEIKHSLGGQSEPYKVYVPEKALQDMEPQEFLPLLRGESKVFVMPFITKLDFASSLMSKLSAANPNRNDIVIGMPTWMADQNLSYGELIANRVRLPVWLYIDENAHSIKAFKKRFFDRYGMVPLYDDAYRAYDIAKYIASAYKDYGSEMFLASEGIVQKLSAMSLKIERQLNDEQQSENFDQIRYFENTAIGFRQFTPSGFISVQ